MFEGTFHTAMHTNDCQNVLIFMLLFTYTRYLQ